MFFPDSAPERGLLVFLVASEMVQVQFRFVGPMMERERERETDRQTERERERERQRERERDRVCFAMKYNMI